jgi:hypothetical protein
MDLMPTRREFIVLAATTSVGCVARATKTSAPSGPPPVVRAPAVGQSWRYAKHDYFTDKVVDTQIDRVSVIGKSVEIESHSRPSPNRSTKTVGDDRDRPALECGAGV